MQATGGNRHGPEELGDAGLIRRVRTGDLEAYGLLHARHSGSAVRLARRLEATGPDLLVSEAFARVLGALEHGEGPDLAFRPHLLGVVADLHRDRTGRHRAPPHAPAEREGTRRADRVVPDGQARRSLAAEAYASLPEPWQVLLWHLDVEGEDLARIASLLDLSERSAAALVARARDGLRRAYLAAHLAEHRAEHLAEHGRRDPGGDHGSCTWAHGVLDGYLHGTGTDADAVLVEAHLALCRPCAALAVEVIEVDRERRRIVAAAVLGASAPAYLAIAGTTVAAGPTAEPRSAPGRRALLGGGHHLRTPTSATGAVGLAAAVLMVGALVNATVVLAPTAEPPPSAERRPLPAPVAPPPYEVVPPAVRTIRALGTTPSGLDVAVAVTPGIVFTLAPPAGASVPAGTAGAAASPAPPSAPLLSVRDERDLGPVSVRVEAEVSRAVEQPRAVLQSATPFAGVPAMRLGVDAH